MAWKKNLKKTLIWLVATSVAVVIGILINELYPKLMHKSDIVLSYGDYALDEDKPVNIFVAVNSEVAIQDEILVPVDFSIRNAGDAPLKDIRLNYHLDSRRLCPPEALFNFMQTKGNVISKDVQFEKHYNDEGCDLVYALNALNEGLNFGLDSVFRAEQRPSEHLILGELPFSAKVIVNIEASSVKRKKYTLVYHFVRRSTMQDMISWYETHYAKADAIQVRDKYNAPAYLWKILFGKKVTSLLIAPAYAQIKGESNRSLWLPVNNKIDARYATYAPYSWSLLIK